MNEGDDASLRWYVSSGTLTIKAGFPLGEYICSREQREKQLDWLATNTDDITSQSHSLFACSPYKFAKWKTGLKGRKPIQFLFNTVKNLQFTNGKYSYDK